MGPSVLRRAGRHATFLSFLCFVSFVSALTFPVPASADARILGASTFYPGRYYPGVDTIEDAERLALLPGQVISTVSIPMRAAGLTIHGRVLGEVASGGPAEPLAGALVRFFHGSLVFDGLTDVAGEYTLEGVPAGSGLLRVATDDPRSRARRHRAVYFPGVDDSASAAILHVEDQPTFEVGDFTVREGAELSGHLVTQDTGEPMAGYTITVTEATTLRAWRLATEHDGFFRQGGLPPGSYTVFADVEATPYISEFLGGVRDPAQATRLELSAGDVHAGLAIDPDRGGEIHGHVRTDAGAPIVGTTVHVIQRSTGRVFLASTSVAGLYRAQGLAANQYVIYVPILGRYFPDEAREEDARPITVVEGEIRDRIDLSGGIQGECRLGPASQGAIRGHVEFDFETTPRVTVRAVSATDTIETVLEATEDYFLECLAAGTYRVGVLAEGGYRRHWHPDALDMEDAQFISVNADTVDRIDFELEEGVVIEGSIIEESNASPIPEARVRAWESFSKVEAIGRTSSTGQFRLEVLPDGTALPAGEWLVYADSTVTPDPEVTPALQPRLRADRLGREVRVEWNLSTDLGWIYEVFRHSGAGTSGEPRPAEGAVQRIAVAEVAPGAAGVYAILDDPRTALTVRYRLAARALAESATDFVVWTTEIDLQPVASPGRILELQVAPRPWRRDGPLSLRFADSETPVGTAEAIRSLTWYAVDGRRVLETPWELESGLAVIDPAALPTAMASGVYYLQARAGNGQTVARGLVVLEP